VNGAGSGGARMRVVLTGPESTGKSLLSVHLSRRFGLPLALEYARAYLEAHGPSYDYELLREMARGHLAHQAEAVPVDVRLGIFDTDLINYKVWCEVVYGKCHALIEEGIAREADHVYLLCAPDTPWAPDPLRENPDDRDKLFELHRREIERLGRRYEVVEGLGASRYARAEEALGRLCGRAFGPVAAQSILERSQGG
jgi:NadR type nicotinamide-nucleotide adenylyltransferase